MSLLRRRTSSRSRPHAHERARSVSRLVGGTPELGGGRASAGQPRSAQVRPVPAPHPEAAAEGDPSGESQGKGRGSPSLARVCSGRGGPRSLSGWAPPGNGTYTALGADGGSEGARGCRWCPAPARFPRAWRACVSGAHVALAQGTRRRRSADSLPMP